MIFQRIAVMLSCAIAFVPRARAQGGRTSLPLLEHAASARSLALGGTGAALAGDDAALFFNPALIAGERSVSASGSIQSYVAGSRLSALSARFGRGPRAMTFAIGAQMLDYGRSDEIIPDPATGGERGIATGGTVSGSELGFSVGASWTLRPDTDRANEGRSLTVGVAGKLLRQEIAGEGGTSGAADVGVAARVFGAVFSIAGQNLGPGLRAAGRSAPLPAALRGGIATRVYDDRIQSVTAIAEVYAVRDAQPRATLALEGRRTLRPAISVALRLGVRNRADSDFASAATVGGGVGVANLDVDYAYQSLGAVGAATHRVGVRWAR
jgi:hypothetical protein